MNTLLLIFCAIALIGGLYAGFARDPYAKLIAIGIIAGAVMPLIIARGYVDVAAVPCSHNTTVNHFCTSALQKGGRMNPEFFAGLILLIIGTWITAFPRDREYLTRLINLEIPAFGLLLVALSFDETLALLTFIAVSTLTTFVLVLLIERRAKE